MSLWTVAAYLLAIVTGALLANFLAWKGALQFIARIGPKMGFELFIASRHLAGKKSWFIAIIGVLALLGVSFSSCTLSTVLSVMGGFGNDLKQKILRAQSHVVVDRVDGNLASYEELLEKIRSVKGVEGATPLLNGEVMIASRINNAGAMLRGVDPESFSQVSDMLRNLTHGNARYLAEPSLLDREMESRRSRFVSRFDIEDAGPTGDAGPKAGATKPAAADAGPSPGSAPAPDAWVMSKMKPGSGSTSAPVMIIGRELAQGLRVFVGDEVSVISPLGDMGPTGPIPKRRVFRIGGTFYSGMYEYDSQYAFVRIDDAQKFLGLGKVSGEIHIRTADPDSALNVAGAISRALGPGYQVRSWQQLNASLFSALNLEKMVMFVFLSLAILVASFCILATLTMLVMEKSSEIAVLATLGADGKSVSRIFRLEGLFIGAVGTLVGLSVGLAVSIALDRLGFRIDPEVWYIDRLPVKINPWEFIAVGGVSLLVSVAATWYPARTAASVHPVEGLRYE